MDLGLKDRVALVTGASKGLGAAIALELAGEGCHLAICSRHPAELEETRAAAAAKGVRCFPTAADITDPASIASLIDGVASTFGRLDILVNNAGGARPGTFGTLSDADLLADYQTKVLGQIRCARAALP